MRYFTPELIVRVASEDDDVGIPAYDEWEAALAKYRRRIEKILGALPAEAHRFREERVCLHDARLVRMGRHGDRFLMVLDAEPPATTTVNLEFTLVGDPVIDPKALPYGGSGDFAMWMYEEFDIDRRGNCWFEVLLTNGWSVKVQFSDFRFAVYERLFPVTPKPAEQSQPPAVPRSA